MLSNGEKIGLEEPGSTPASRLAPGSLGLGSPSPAGPGGGAALPSVITSRHSSHIRLTSLYDSYVEGRLFTVYRPRLVRLGRRLRPCGRPLTSLHFSRESSEHRGSPRAASRPRARPGSGASTRPGRTPLYDRGSATRQALLTGAAWTAYRSSTHKRAESILSNLWH